MARRRKFYGVELRQRAHEDLVEIWLFIARSHPLNADHYVQKIHNAIGDLAAFPTMHPAAPSLTGLGVRQLLVGSHRILYVIDEASAVVDVLRVIHQKERIEKYAVGLLDN